MVGIDGYYSYQSASQCPGQVIKGKTTMIKEFPVTWTVDRLYCDECGEEMRYTGELPQGSNALYPHKCKNGHEQCIPGIYPMLISVEQEAEAA
jgi:hypothetical protein